MNCECIGCRGETKLDSYISWAKKISNFLEQQIPSKELSENIFQNLAAKIAAEFGYNVCALWLDGTDTTKSNEYSTIYKPLTIIDAFGLRFNIFFKVNAKGEFLIIAQSLSVGLAAIPSPEAQVSG